MRWRRELWRSARLRAARLKKMPMLGQSAAAGALYSGGDFAAQKIEEAYGVQSIGKEDYNYERTLRMGTFGLFFAGPILVVWYRFLHRMTSVYRVSYVKMEASAGSWLNTLAMGFYKEQVLDKRSDLMREVFVKVVFDNIFFQAVFLNFYFFVMSMLEGRTPYEAWNRCKRDFHDAWGYSLCFWVPAQTLNFSLFSTRHHPLVVSVLNAFWKAFLSVLYHWRDFGSMKEPDTQGAATSSRVVDDTLQLQLAEQQRQLLIAKRQLERMRRQIDESLCVIEAESKKLRAIVSSEPVLRSKVSQSKAGTSAANISSARAD
mmetsp:Transcript_76388/g.212198  ORF Transcript_76388/g.212198 Transcript_76388/m.212198 type:complete len:317 (-) Transcript_76388:52-1002(-)